MSTGRKVKSITGPFVPLLHDTIDSRAWRSMSHGAKSLYVCLRRRVPKGRNTAYVSYREAEKELRSSQRKIGEWFRELEHFGFIRLSTPGCLGVEGMGKSPHWRLTELGATSKASAGGLFEPATVDFMSWDGTPFVPQRKKQNPASYGGYTPLPTWKAVALPTGDTPKCQSASDGVGIQRDESASYGVGITSKPYIGGLDVSLSEGKLGDKTRSLDLPKMRGDEKCASRNLKLVDGGLSLRAEKSSRSAPPTRPHGGSSTERITTTPTSPNNGQPIGGSDTRPPKKVWTKPTITDLGPRTFKKRRSCRRWGSV